MAQSQLDLTPADLVLQVSSFVAQELDGKVLNAISAPTSVGQAVNLGFKDEVGQILDALTGMPAIVADAVSDSIMAPISALISAGDSLVSDLDSFVSEQFERVTGGFVQLIDSLDGIVVQPIKNALDVGFEAVKGLDDVLLAAADTVLEQAETIIGDIAGTLRQLIQDMGEGLVGIGAAIKDSVTGASSALTDKVEEGFSFAARGLFEHMAPDVVKRIDPLLKILEDDEDTPEEIRALTYPGMLLETAVGGFIAALVIPFLIAPALHTIIQPWLLKVQQKVNRIARPSLLTPAELVNAYHRNLIPWDDVLMDGGKAGFTDQDLGHLSTMLKLRPSTSEAIDFWRRGLVTDDDLDANLTLIGWDAAQVSMLRLAAYPPPPVGDLITMAVREVFTPEVAERFGQFEDIPEPFIGFASQIGLSKEWATRYWGAHWALPSAQQGFEMLHRGIIEVSDLELLLRSLDVMPFWRDRLTQIAFTPFTRVDIRRMHKVGVLTDADVLRAYLDIGYDADKAQLQQQFVIALNTDEVKIVTEKERDLSKSDIIGLYNDGLLTDSQTLESLAGIGYSSAEAELLVSRETMQQLTKARKDDIQDIIELAKAGVHSYNAAQDALSRLDMAQPEMALAMRQIERATAVKTRQPSKADLDSWLENEIIDVAVYQDELGHLGYDSKYISLYTQAIGIDAKEAQETQVERAARAAEPRRETKADLDRLRLGDVISAQEYLDGLTGLRYTASAMARFSTQIEATIKEQRDAITARDRAAGIVQPRTESKADLDKLYLARIINIVDFEAGLSQLRFDAPSIANFVALIVQTRKARDDKRAEALASGIDPTPDERMPSRTDLDRFALGDLISLQAYQDALRSLHFAPGTVQLYTNLVLAKGAFGGLPEIDAPIIEEPPDERMPSRADLDRFAVANLISLETYQQGLRDLDFASDVITLFTDLVIAKGAFGGLPEVVVPVVEEPPDERKPSRADLDRFAIANLITIRTYQQGLRDLDFASGVITLFTDLVIAKGAFGGLPEE